MKHIFLALAVSGPLVSVILVFVLVKYINAVTENGFALAVIALLLFGLMWAGAMGWLYEALKREPF